MQIPLTRPYLTGAEGEAVTRVIASGWISQGPTVQAFEAAFAQRVGAADAVATTNCTTALHLALHVNGIGPGDDVIIPSLSFIATANAVVQCGARPVFADVDRWTWNLDPTAAEQAITPRTKAIMPVHQIGLPADMDPLLELAQRRGLAVIEDAACAVGARYKGRPIGSLGPLTCFSLHPRKVITTGEGGMIAVQDRSVAQRLRRLRAHGMSLSDLARHAANRIVDESYPERGFNYRMTDMQAALGLCQLEVLDEVLRSRRRLADRYTRSIERLPNLEPPFDPTYATRTWQAYCIRVLPTCPVRVPELRQRLLDDGIATKGGVMAIHLEPAYGRHGARLPNTEDANRDVLTLPLFPTLTDEEQDYVLARLGAHVSARAAA
jgi:perosamine synthetase